MWRFLALEQTLTPSQFGRQYAEDIITYISLNEHISEGILIQISVNFGSTGPIGKYRQVSNIRRILVGNKIVDNSDVVGASPVGAAPTTSSLST